MQFRISTKYWADPPLPDARCARCTEGLKIKEIKTKTRQIFRKSLMQLVFHNELGAAAAGAAAAAAALTPDSV